MPIFSQWSRHTRQSVSGMLLMKWSCLSQKPSLCICSSRWEPGMGGCFPQASAQAWSSATGSKEANMPTSGTMGRSFSPWQSQ